MQWIVERITEGIVILEQPDLTHIHCPLSEFSTPVHEGDVLILENGVYCVDEVATRERKERLRRMTRNLFNK